jgi:hypothetical protein
MFVCSASRKIIFDIDLRVLNKKTLETQPGSFALP